MTQQFISRPERDKKYNIQIIRDGRDLGMFRQVPGSGVYINKKGNTPDEEYAMILRNDEIVARALARKMLDKENKRQVLKEFGKPHKRQDPK